MSPNLHQAFEAQIRENLTVLPEANQQGSQKKFAHPKSGRWGQAFNWQKASWKCKGFEQ